MLAGSAAALREVIAAPNYAYIQAELERRLEPARRALSARAYGAAWAAGRQMSMEQAISNALTVDSIPATATVVAKRPPAVQLQALSPRELEVAVLIGHGLSNFQGTKKA